MLFLHAIDFPCSFKIFWEAQAWCVLSTEWFSWVWHECSLISMCHFYCDVIKVRNLLPLNLRSERLKQAAGITCKRKVHSCKNHTGMSFVSSKGYILDLKGRAHLTDTHANEVHAFYFRSTESSTFSFCAKVLMLINMYHLSTLGLYNNQTPIVMQGWGSADLMQSMVLMNHK